MITSSAFVLAALTMTGVYMQTRDQEAQDNGYTIDFSALENAVDDKFQEIAKNDVDSSLEDDIDPSAFENDLDYMPAEEAGSSLVEIPGLTDRGDDEEDQDAVQPSDQQSEPVVEEPDAATESTEQNAVQTDGQSAQGSPIVTQELHFSESNGLVRPLSGEIVMGFSADTSAYFKTLKLYKRNYATLIGAAEGTAVAACAAGRVVDIFQNEEIGHAVTVDHGDGYQITYGQLRDIQVSLGSYVDAGDVIASVAAPTKYYVVEGSNLYLQLTLNGTPINAEALFR